jgi:uncharacterized protein involved in exopolysaccharide biosynthesis
MIAARMMATGRKLEYSSPMINSASVTPPPHPNDSPGHAQDFAGGSPGDPLAVVLGARRMIAGVAIVIGVLAGLLSWTTTPVFRAEVTLVPAKSDDRQQLSSLGGGLGGLASLAGVSLGDSDDETNRAIAILHSRDFTDAFIRDNNLVAALCVNCNAWWRFGMNRRPTARHAYDNFDRNVRFIDEDKKVNTVTLAIEWSDPQVAARWANELIARVNRREQQQAIEEASRNIAFLNEQLSKTDVTEMRQLVYRLIETKTSDVMLAAGRPEYAFTVIDPAVKAESRIRPRRILDVLTGLVLGLIAGTGFVLVRPRIQQALRQS